MSMGYSRVEMEVQEEEHVAFSIHWNSLMLKEEKKKGSEA